ncbi:helicase-related protein [Psychromonas hadalis]|uniref:helicase-related protein n=1 Tax=Psychromonas hadalis TaxID=211669 RepID=UPI0003B30B14
MAEITRLRQACCHPKLVNAALVISSAKQQAFIELVEDLIEKKHKALVFSQFVGHLSLLKAVLIERNISFQYLDGSTPAKKRQQASDRAHRMRQLRPVTIYRMIMENSIEEKIIALHAQKRDLANNLLSGNEKVSGKLDVEQMLALLE